MASKGVFGAEVEESIKERAHVVIATEGIEPTTTVDVGVHEDSAKDAAADALQVGTGSSVLPPPVPLNCQMNKHGEYVPYCANESWVSIKGMTFDDIEEGKKFYERYAISVGFSVRSYSHTKDNNGYAIRCSFYYTWMLISFLCRCSFYTNVHCMHMLILQYADVHLLYQLGVPS